MPSRQQQQQQWGLQQMVMNLHQPSYMLLTCRTKAYLLLQQQQRQGVLMLFTAMYMAYSSNRCAKADTFAAECTP
jgi:Zn-dependent protease with chaperone function